MHLAQHMDLIQGTLDMLILKAVSLGPLHGYGVLLRIQQISRDRLEIQQGSLYPALYRLKHHGLIASEWGESENKRKAKYYHLTAAGRRHLPPPTPHPHPPAATTPPPPPTAPAELSRRAPPLPPPLPPP